jgi:hypothetical protein
MLDLKQLDVQYVTNHTGEKRLSFYLSRSFKSFSQTSTIWRL